MSDFKNGESPFGATLPPKRDPYTHANPTPPASSDERTWAMLCHLSVFVGGFIGPLVVWLIKKDESALVDDQGKEALNFQLSVLLYTFICIPLAFVIIGIFLAMALGIFNLVVTIMATVKASQGEYYRYPLCIRFIP